MSASRSRVLIVCLVLFAFCCPLSQALTNGLALTPPMGYNTWNAFRCDIDETIVRDNIDLMIRLGLRDAGYVYFNLDDCWQLEERDENGELQPNTTRFPSGMKKLSDYVHDKGMKFGLYSDAGEYTCQHKAGSFGHEEQDAATFASFGADYLKYDNCFSPPLEDVPVRDRYAAMRDALNKTGRPIVYSICEWGVNQPHLWAPGTGNLWRTANDINQQWDSVLRSLDNQIGLAMYAEPGAWNDPDMLEVGNPGTHGEMPIYRQQAHFALWALMKAPLLIGTDLRNIADESLDILLNREVIAINQDSLGVSGDLIFQHGPLQVFAAPLAGGARAVAFFYRQVKGQPASMTVYWDMLGYPDDLPVTVRDLHAREDLGVHSGKVEVSVERDSVVLIKLSPDLDLWRMRGGGLPAGQQAVKLRGHESLRRASELLSNEDIISELDTWRPWSHGFFGKRQEL